MAITANTTTSRRSSLIRLIEENNELRAQLERGTSPGPRLADELGVVKAELDRVQRDKAAAEQAARAAQAELAQERARDAPITAGSDQQVLKVLTLAQRTADDHVADARREADTLLSDARLIGVMGTLSRDRDTVAALHLVLTLAALAESLADLREAQQRLHQARAARHAAGQLRDYRPPAGTPGAGTADAPAARPIVPDPARRTGAAGTGEPTARGAPGSR
jgi:hypothetical protein